MWIICCGMQRSGSTLQYNLAREIAEAHGKTKIIGFVTPQDFDATYAQTEKDYDFVIVKSHKFLRGAKDLIDKGEATAVYCYRDMRDAILSRLNKTGVPFHRTRAKNWTADSIRMYDQWTSVNSILISRYEDMMADLEAEAHRIANHLGITLSAEMASELAAKYSLDAQKQRISEFDFENKGLASPSTARYDPTTQIHSNHIHSGETEQWRTAFLPDQIRFIERQAYDWLTKLGYPITKAKEQAPQKTIDADFEGHKHQTDPQTDPKAARREKIRLLRRESINKSRNRLAGKMVHFSYEIFEATGFGDQLDRLRLVHNLGTSMGFTYVHAPFHLPRSSDGLDKFIGLKDHFPLKTEDFDPNNVAFLDLTLDEMFKVKKFNTLLDLRAEILRQVSLFSLGEERQIIVRFTLLRNAQPGIRVETKSKKGKVQRRNQLRPTIALDRWFAHDDPDHLNFRAIFEEARAKAPRKSVFAADEAKTKATAKAKTTAKTNVLVHVRQGDVAMIETPWNTFLPVKYLLGNRKSRFSELSKFEHAGDTFVDLKEYHGFLNNFLSHADCPARSVAISSDGFDRGFDNIFANREETGLSEDILHKLEDIRDGYDERAFSIFDNLDNCQCLVGETDENLFDLISAVLKADIIVAGTQQRMVPQLLDLYPRPENPPIVIVLHKNADYENGWTYPYLRPVGESSAHFIPARLDALDMDSIVGEVNKILAGRRAR